MKTSARAFSWLLWLGALSVLSMPAGAVPLFTTLYSFPQQHGPGGSRPLDGLIRGSDGDFYGTASDVSAGGVGSVFKITPDGTLTTLANFDSFDPAGGSTPVGGLVQGTDGNFYGTTVGGGNGGYGTVFQITPSGTLTTLYSFTGGNDGKFPTTALVQGSDGDFYGTTSYGGPSQNGSVFKLVTDGTTAGTTLTTLHIFAGGTEGRAPSGLIQGSDGNFYGTTASGGSTFVSGAGHSPGYGTVFKIAPTGTLTTIANFHNASDGGFPGAALVQGRDGIFYGTTAGGGRSFEGTVFKMTAAGAVTTLYSFSSLDGNQCNSDGASPNAALVQGSDGSFYGTTYHGGSSGYGTVFKITPAGTLTTLAEMPSGDQPAAGLAQGSDGDFYGLTREGGANGTGVVYRLDAGLSFPSLTSATPASGPVGTVVTITGTNLSGVTAVRFHDANATVFSVNAAGTQITATVPGSALSGTIRVTTLDGSVQTATPFTATPLTAKPTITSFSPSSGLTGTGVVITGTNLGATTYVAFGGVPAAFTVDSPTQITAIVPNTVPNGAAVLTVASAFVTLLPGEFFAVYGGAPIPVSISPASGPVGTVVTITGMRFDGVSAVRFHDADATVFSASADGATVTGTVPAGALSGTLKITTPLGTTQSTAAFTVTP